jgi:hypothetical protein
MAVGRVLYQVERVVKAGEADDAGLCPHDLPVAVGRQHNDIVAAAEADHQHLTQQRAAEDTVAILDDAVCRIVQAEVID